MYLRNYLPAYLSVLATSNCKLITAYSIVHTFFFRSTD